MRKLAMKLCKFYFILLLCFFTCRGIVVDNQPFYYEMSNEQILSKTLIELVGYNEIIIRDNTFVDTTFHILNVTSLNVTNNKFSGYYSNSTLKMLNVEKTAIENNEWFGDSQISRVLSVIQFNCTQTTSFTNSTSNQTTIIDTIVLCNRTVASIYTRSEVEVYFNDSMPEMSRFLFKNNTLRINNQNIPNRFLSFMRMEVDPSERIGFPYNDPITIPFPLNHIQISNFEVSDNFIVITRTNPFALLNVLKGSVNTTYCSVFNQYDFNTTYYTERFQRAPMDRLIENAGFFFDFNKVFATTPIEIHNNGIQFDATTPVTKNLHTHTDWIYDSTLFFRIGDLIAGPDMLKIQDNWNLLTFNNLKLKIPPPIRVGLMITNSTLAKTLNLLPLNNYTFVKTPSYQFGAALINSLNPALIASQFKTQLERNSNSDEFSGWDECHYACKDFCGDCILSEKTGVQQEFSEFTHGICFNRQVFSNSTKATRLCRHENLYITPPTTIYQAGIFSSKNKVNGILKILPRNSSTGGVIFVMDDTSGYPDDHYRYSYDSVKYIANSDDYYFVINHPNLILPVERWEFNETSKMFEPILWNENAAMKSLSFSNIRFVLSTSGSNQNIFSILALNPNQTAELSLISFTNCHFSAKTSEIVFGNPYGIIQNKSSEIAYTTTSKKLLKFEFINNTIIALGMISNGPLFADIIIVKNTEMSQMNNGFMVASVRNYTSFTNNSCVGCEVNGDLKTWLTVTGTREDVNTTSSVSNNKFIANFPTSINFPGYRSLKIEGFNQIEISNNKVSEKYTIGLYYSNLGNIPCAFVGFVKLDQSNPDINGTVRDFECDPSGLSCKDDTCYDHISLARENCIVNQSHSIADPLYRIQFFTSIKQALRLCWAHFVCDILLVPGIYHETSISFTPKPHTNLTMRIRPYSSEGRAIIVGNSHIITRGPPPNILFNIEFQGIDFVNPLGLVGPYVSGDSQYILSSTDASLHNCSISNSNFYGWKPITPIAYFPPSGDLNQWQLFLNNLRNTPSFVHPRMREPNTRELIYLTISGVSNYTSVGLFGAYRYGLFENRIAPNPTIIMNVTGENMWSWMIFLDGQYETEIRGTVCSEFCGGLTTLTSNVQEIRFGRGILYSGRKFIYIDNRIEVGAQAIANPYVFSRMPYGTLLNPYTGFLSTFSGRLAAVHVADMQGNNWIDFKWRNNYIPGPPSVPVGFPIGVRLENSDNATIHGFNFQTILFRDDLMILRQLQLDNNPPNAIQSLGGQLIDLKSGTQTQDNYVTETNVCNNQCIPDPSSLICTVDTSQPPETQNFHDLCVAIRKCLFNTIAVVDPILKTDCSTSFAYDGMRFNPSTLTIISYSASILQGTFTIDQTLSLSDSIPADIVFMDIFFTNSNFAPAGSSIIKINGPSPYIPGKTINSMTLSNVGISIINQTYFNGNIDAITCSGCDYSTLTIKNSQISGPFRNGFYLDATSSNVPPNLVIQKTSIRAQNAYTNIRAKSIQIEQNTFICENPTPIYGCSYQFGMASAEKRKYSNNVIKANGGTSVPFTGFVWNLAGAFTLERIGEILNATSSNTISSTSYGIHVISNGLDSEIPCVTFADTTIRSISVNNPDITSPTWRVILTDQNGILLAHILASTGDLQCFRAKSVEKPSDILFVLLTIGGVIIFVGGFLCIWWFQIIRLCWGIKFIERDSGVVSSGGSGKGAYKKLKTNDAEDPKFK